MSTPRLRPGSGSCPTLTPGRDPMPTRCSSCGSAMLGHAPATGGDLFGSVTCALCGTTLAYLRPAARTAPQAPPAPPAPPAPTPPAPDWRRPDCDDRCERMRVLPIGRSAVGRYRPEWIEQHDPDAHARHQSTLTLAVAVLVAPPLAPWDVVVGTGPLAVDLGEHRCMVDGRLVHLAPTEAALLEHFARRLGRACTIAGITADVWPWSDPTNDRAFRVTLSRLLLRLGAARRLLARRDGVGYLLLDEPYTGPVDFPQPAPPAAPPWSKAHPACVGCGTTEQRHQGHGLCPRCRYHRTPRDLRHPGRPRKDTSS